MHEEQLMTKFQLRSRILLFALMPLFGLLFQPANAQVQTFGSLSVGLVDWRASGGQFEITLRLENISIQSGRPHEIAVSANFTPQVSDFTDVGWYFDGGNSMGLPLGRNADDWVVLRPGGSIPVVYRFRKNYNYHEPPIKFNARFRLYVFDNRTPQVIPVYLGPLGEPRRPPDLYPTPR
jgi:hypothetical protein